MRRCHRQGDPFFRYIATNAPHTPLWVPDQYRQPCLGEVERSEASFFGMIANIDENMGRLESYLKETGLRENAILIFMKDNGTATGENVFNAGMRGKKQSLYDGGHRVPCFVRWPDGGVSGRRDVQRLTRSTDVLPTLIDLCGLHVDDRLIFDGLSFASTLHQKVEPQVDRMAVVQYGHANEGTNGQTEKNHAAVLWQKWRLVNGTELYEVSADVGQTQDVSASSQMWWVECKIITKDGGRKLAIT